MGLRRHYGGRYECKGVYILWLSLSWRSTHSLDNFFKNVFSDKEKIKMKGIEGEFDWGSDIFFKPFTESWDVIKFITNHSTPHSIFRDISNDVESWIGTPKPNFCELIKFGETRFASRLLLLERYYSLQIVIEALVSNPRYKNWLASQNTETRSILVEGRRNKVNCTEN